MSNYHNTAPIWMGLVDKLVVRVHTTVTTCPSSVGMTLLNVLMWFTASVMSFVVKVKRGAALIFLFPLHFSYHFYCVFIVFFLCFLVVLFATSFTSNPLQSR